MGKSMTDRKEQNDYGEKNIVLWMLKQTTAFLLFIIWGILVNNLFVTFPRRIWRLIKFICIELYNLVKSFFIWLKTSFWTICKIFFYSIVIIFLLLLLSGIILLPVLLFPGNKLLFFIWLLILIIPGIVVGIRSWRKHGRKKTMKTRIIEALKKK